MIYRLIVLNGPLKNQRVTVDLAPMTLGSDPACDFRLPDPEIAKRHAMLEHRPEGLFIHDLGSMNKVLVNKIEVRESRLKHGDTIELGRTRFLVQALVQAEVMETGLAAHKRRVVAILALLALGALIFVAAGALWRRIDMVALLAPPPAPARPAYSAPIAPSPANPAAHPTALIETDIITNPTPTAAMTTPPPPAPTTTANVAVEPAPEQPTPPPPPPPAPQLTIVSADQNRLPQREDADEIRLLKITLDNAEPAGAVDPRAVRLDVVFFDETEPGQFAPSAAARPIAPLIPEGAWEPGIPKTLNATYFVPRGARSAAGQTTGRFHGYVIRLFYRGILQDELAWPRNLLRASALKSEPADRAAR